MIRGIRGAITAKKNTRQEILGQTERLLKTMASLNQVQPADIAAIILTTTPDLNAEFPAAAAQRLGWEDVPRLCAVEIKVPKSLKKCIRVMLLVNTGKSQKQIKHVYLEAAVKLKSGDRS